MRPFLTLHHPRKAEQYYRDGLWQKDTFYSLMLRNAEVRPDVTALVDSNGALTWAQLCERVDAVAAELVAQGLKAGDRVSIWMSNRLECVIIFLACSRQGYACNPSLHRSHTRADVQTLLTRLNARALFIEDGWGADRKPGDRETVRTEVPSLGLIYEPHEIPASAGAAPAPVDDPDKVTYLAFTSGTTGVPKCVMHSDNTLLANARDLVRDWEHDESLVLLSLSPLSHHIAWVGVGQWLLAGGRYVVGDPRQGDSRLDWIIENQATYVMGVPTHAMDILAEQRARGIARLGVVRTFYMAGAAIPSTLAESFVQQGILPQNVYGMTENSSHQYTHPQDSTDAIVNSCGKGGRAYEIALFDPDNTDRQLALGEVGEIGGRGASLMLGYFDNQTATEKSFNAAGWFLSGDLGRIDEQGMLRIVGRAKDVIIRGGHNIYPTDIENMAMRHEAVIKAACFPVADARLGERVCIAVIGSITAEALIAFLSETGLSKYDLPEYFISLDAFPLTASGKVLKRELADMAAKGKIHPALVRVMAATKES